MYDMDTPEPTARPIPETEDYRESREDFELRILKNPKVEIKAVPNAPTGDAEEIFYYLKYVLEENFDMPSIGRAFEMARDNLRKISLQSELDKKPYQNEMWEMSKTSNIYQKEKAGYGLNERDKTAVLEKVDSWIEVIKKKREEEERKKRERLERERKERERKEQERLEKERREKERKERERLEKEKREREKREKERLEKERKEREKELERAKEEKAKEEALAKEEKIAQTKLEAESDQAKKSALKKPLGIAFLLSLITNIILIMYIILIS
jgi:flagellar biosynthesis GTPase FlhF